MKKKGLFYSLFALAFLGSVGLTEIENSKVANVVVGSSQNTNNEGPDEEREESYEAREARAEADEPSIIALQ